MHLNNGLKGFFLLEEWELIFNETKEVISTQAFIVLTEVIESPDSSQIPASESFSNLDFNKDMELMDFWRIAIKYLSIPASSGLLRDYFPGKVKKKEKKEVFTRKKLIISIAVGLSILTPSSEH
ncbi:hypothetical protein BpHYR1_026596 [Brachionus plicatilis]|uniref:Uncharacterized protein n=1 Tax=Brachionus plicatilis TaxID=10195 RepID=A0A3M7P6W9_BRAPC|nr:hypothetical protein BpHYR1_026596 [Brachionus plicatilis]